jgi:hypothetical protein
MCVHRLDNLCDVQGRIQEFVTVGTVCITRLGINIVLASYAIDYR